MEGYTNRREYSLRYTDFDFRDELKLSSYLSFAQESAAASADELGFGYLALQKLGYGFITVTTYGEIVRQVGLGTKITVETWPMPPRHVFFERQYRFTDGDGEIAKLTSRWCLVDLSTFDLLLPTALGETHARCPYNSARCVDPVWRIPQMGTEEKYRMTVRTSRCDHYLHANNTEYANFFTDCFSMDELRGRHLDRFTISYEKQAKEGSELVLSRADLEGGSVLEAKSGGETLARALLTFKENADEA